MERTVGISIHNENSNFLFFKSEISYEQRIQEAMRLDNVPGETGQLAGGESCFDSCSWPFDAGVMDKRFGILDVSGSGWGLRGPGLLFLAARAVMPVRRAGLQST
jgi:hypothetical protein